VAATPDALGEVLARARELGFLGPGPVEPQIEHARGFATAWFASGKASPPRRFLDLGSGGGIPGLLLATQWPTTPAVLLDAGQRRAAFLEEAIVTCGLAAAEAHQGRAEEVGRAEGFRASFDLVVARSFGPPPVTAECAAPMLEQGGTLLVSGAPNGSDEERWSVEGLARLGLGEGQLVLQPSTYRLFTQVELCPERYPRRVGIPAKRPLF
jgi:16S rRNA (guanine527-N7)-methyltransferase